MSCVFFFNDTPAPEIYTLSLHDALPILHEARGAILLEAALHDQLRRDIEEEAALNVSDRKSTRLNSSHGYISYAVFCLKKKRMPAPPQRLDAYAHGLGLAAHHLAERRLA